MSIFHFYKFPCGKDISKTKQSKVYINKTVVFFLDLDI